MNGLAGGLSALQTSIQDPLQHAAADLATAATSAANAAVNAIEMLRGGPGQVTPKRASLPVESPVQLAKVAECRPKPSAPDYAPKKTEKTG
jgi:hypothetical protein